MKTPFLSQADLGKHAVASSTVSGSGVDMKDFDGFVHITHSIHNAAKSSARKLNGRLQHSNSASSGFSNAPGTNITEVGNVDTSVQHQVVRISELKRFVRVRYTPTSSGASFVAFCSIVGYKDITPPAT